MSWMRPGTRSSKFIPRPLVLALLLLLHSTACSYLSYDIKENEVELAAEETSRRDFIRVEESEIVGSTLQLGIVRGERVEQRVESRTERTVDYEVNPGWVYEGAVNPIIDGVLIALYFIPDSLAFLLTGAVMAPAGAISAIDSTDEKTLDPEVSAAPLASAPVEITIRALKLRELGITDAEGRIVVDLSAFGTYEGTGPLGVRILSARDGLVAKSTLDESQLAELRRAVPLVASAAKAPAVPRPETRTSVTPPTPPAPTPAPRVESVEVQVSGRVGEAQIARTVEVATAASADSRRRVALVIGNSGYRSLPPLTNPEHDASDLAKVLERVGFEVILRQEQNLSQMKSGLREFAARLGPETVGLFYYAGHAIQSDGSNFLIPLGADIQAQDEIEYETLDMARVLGKMEASQSPVKLVFVDACRNNPFSRFRSASRGLAITPAPGGTLIAYATAPGDVASDGDGSNSPFARHLISAIDTPGLELKQVIAQVQQGVYLETESRQRPWLSSDIFRPFYFQPPGTN